MEVVCRKRGGGVKGGLGDVCHESRKDSVGEQGTGKKRERGWGG